MKQQAPKSGNPQPERVAADYLARLVGHCSRIYKLMSCFTFQPSLQGSFPPFVSSFARLNCFLSLSLSRRRGAEQASKSLVGDERAFRDNGPGLPGAGQIRDQIDVIS